MPTILEEAVAARARIMPWTVEPYHRAIVTGLLAEDSYSRVEELTRGDSLDIAAGSACVAVPVDHLLP